MSPLTKSYIASSMLFIVSLLLLSGCGDKNSSAHFVTDTGEHLSGWLPLGHKADAVANIESCTECHGSDYAGGIARVSCSKCHLGGYNAVHPLEWGDFTSTRHADFVTQNGSSACANASCHGSDLKGVSNSGPSCNQCHLGGYNAAHPLEWGNLAYARHADYVTQNGTSTCANASCHGSDLKGVSNSGPSCTSCHMGGINSYHPVDWTADSSAHPNYGDLSSCANITCHGAQLQGVAESGPACTACHN